MEISEEEKIQVATRLCPRTKQQVRLDLWDAHQSALTAKLTDYMYLGGERNASNHKELTYRTNIGFILNASWEVGNHYPQEFEYLRLPLQDFKGQAGALAKDLNKSADFIDRARSYNSAVMIHCVAGISRSSSVCIHYLMTREGRTLKDAYQHVLKLRPTSHPWKFMPDDKLKQGWLDDLWPDDKKDNIVCVFDDRDKVVQMWRENGLNCFQVAEGAF